MLSKRRFFVLFSFFLLSFSTLSFGEDFTQYGAVLIRDSARPNAQESLPQVSFSETDAEWRVLDGEKYTGIDGRRFYFTVEAKGTNLPAPKVEVVWEGVKILRVIGAKGEVEETASGRRFTISPRNVPTDAFTEVSFGAVKLGVFHNWEIRRAGPYREGAYPANEIKAQLNYMLGALEVCRAYGWTESETPDFVDHINLYGFETHFPHGHRDFPAHFHIMLAWDGWKAANVGHYLLDDSGKILRNNFWILHKDVEIVDQPGVVTKYVDKTNRVVFETTILSDGSGLIFKKLGFEREYLIHAGKNGAVESVEVCARNADSNDEWELVCEVRANDDAEKGVFSSRAQYVDGSIQRVEFKYDPDTGARLDK